MAVEWNQVDVALFERLPASMSHLGSWSKRRRWTTPVCRRCHKPCHMRSDSAAMSPPYRYRWHALWGLREIWHMEPFKLHAYMNLARLRHDYPAYGCGGAEDALLRWPPSGSRMSESNKRLNTDAASRCWLSATLGCITNRADMIKRDAELAERNNELSGKYGGALNALILVSGFGALFIIAYSAQAHEFSQFFSIAAGGLLVSGASLLVGCLIGFLLVFLGHYKKRDKLLIPQTRGPKSNQLAVRLSIDRNTNLEEISDWLTKILVGVA